VVPQARHERIISIISILPPFALSQSKGERGVFHDLLKIFLLEDFNLKFFRNNVPSLFLFSNPLYDHPLAIMTKIITFSLILVLE